MVELLGTPPLATASEGRALLIVRIKYNRYDQKELVFIFDF